MRAGQIYRSNLPLDHDKQRCRAKARWEKAWNSSNDFFDSEDRTSTYAFCPEEKTQSLSVSHTLSHTAYLSVCHQKIRHCLNCSAIEIAQLKRVSGLMRFLPIFLSPAAALFGKSVEREGRERHCRERKREEGGDALASVEKERGSRDPDFNQLSFSLYSSYYIMHLLVFIYCGSFAFFFFLFCCCLIYMSFSMF